MDESEDIGVSPIEAQNEGVWQAGESGNPAGRPKGSKNSRPRSKMRTTLTKLYTLQADAIDIIKESLKKPVKGTPPVVDKVQLDTAKFVIKAIESLNNTCLREEMAILGVKQRDAGDGDILASNQLDESKSEKLKAFSMDQVESDIKH